MLQLVSSFLVWIAIGMFQATLGAKFYDTSVSGPASPCFPGTPCTAGQAIVYDTSVSGPASPCFPGTPCTAGQAFHPPKFQPNRPEYPARPAFHARPAKVSYQKSFSRDSELDSFHSTFVQAIRSSQTLTELFSCFSHISALEFCNGKYPEILEALTEVGAPNPEFASHQAVETISETYDTLTSDIVIRVYTNSIAKYLLTQGVLTQQNAVQLGKQYAKTMEEAADCNDSPYTALKEGFVNFLDSLGLFSSDKALLIALHYGNEWRLASKPSRRG